MMAVVRIPITQELFADAYSGSLTDQSHWAGGVVDLAAPPDSINIMSGMVPADHAEMIVNGQRLRVDRIETRGDQIVVHFRAIDHDEYMRQYEDEYMRQCEERRRAKHEANYRAEKLLMSHLNEEQRLEWLQHRYFTVTSQSGKCFQIVDNPFQNIWELDKKGRRCVNYCIVFMKEDMPLSDLLLVQKLMLESNESEFMKIAMHGSVIDFGRPGVIEAARYWLTGS
jgi:hypothetical protein